MSSLLTQITHEEYENFDQDDYDDITLPENVFCTQATSIAQPIASVLFLGKEHMDINQVSKAFEIKFRPTGHMGGNHIVLGTPNHLTHLVQASAGHDSGYGKNSIV